MTDNPFANMKSSEDVIKEFKEELRELLEKYGTSLEIQYPQHAGEYIEAYIPHKEDADRNWISDGATVILGSCFP